MAEELQVGSSLPISLFDYELPNERIAQEPITPRDSARLMLVQRARGTVTHHHVRDLSELLTPGDLLVFNNTRVVPARLYGVREETGGKWEGLFLRADEDGLWELMCQTRGRLAAGETILVQDLRLCLVEKTSAGHWLARPEPPGDWLKLLEQFGHVPLPPYIRKGQDQPGDRERYQTVFAQTPGAVAAPTAGLHFTPELLAKLEQRGIKKAFVTLHVGAGTFRPIEVDDITQHTMYSEWAELPAAAVEAIHTCKSRGGRVVAVGTTSVRVLETAARVSPPLTKGGQGGLTPWTGQTNLYIYPPYPFQVVDALLTNFHLPRSSLLVLVSAFAGIDLVRHAYEIAIRERYRFYSYGDAMLVM